MIKHNIPGVKFFVKVFICRLKINIYDKSQQRALVLNLMFPFNCLACLRSKFYPASVLMLKLAFMQQEAG